MLDITEVKEYLGITYDDSDSLITRYMKVATSWLNGAIGHHKEDDERAKQLALFVIEDLYDRGSLTVKENKAIERLKRDFILQLQNEDV